MYGTPSAWRVPGYTEIRELGAGAAGRVVMARHDADDIVVAIKYLSDELRSDVGFVARFRHEARVLNTLNSPHSVRLYDYVETGDGAAIVMELVNGVALRTLLRSEGPTGPEAALLVLKGSLLGLAAAHSAGVVHRDFKPENVMVGADGRSKLVDFGIAVRSGDGDTPAGTPPYMAPEQWVGGPAGPATDVYAATIVFFECLTGTRPFRATNIAALARQHQVMPPPIEEVPSALQGLVERGLAKHPADRPPTASAFLTELEAVAADAYGPDWQERGRRRLAGIAGLLAAMFPMDTPVPGADTSLAMTELDGDDGGGRTSSVSRLSVKILVGVGCIAVIGGLTAVLVGSGDPTEIQSQSSVTSQSPTPSDPLETLVPEDETDEIDEPVEESPSAGTPTPTPTPSTTASSGLPPVAPTATSAAATPTPSARPTRRPTTRPTRTPTQKPPSTTPTAEESTTLDDSPRDPGRPTTRPPSTAPTQPTTAPTSSPTQPTEPSPSSEPTPTETGPSSPGTETPKLTASPLPPVEATPAAFLALGLVTSGAVPFTLAVKRGLTGRHRKRR
ncbi:serine/threonine protein kinase [Streptosporangium sp. NBC_01469]|uniref:serine/threonine protein kinase n=1 Tax=Streptosporangium sp. NBC_01469 TaxID=2903898 RepID=UPI002E2869B8|nr:protein kinase [Streptosporangium sp. NBC_01469]